jgi:hypothetical protein
VKPIELSGTKRGNILKNLKQKVKRKNIRLRGINEFKKGYQPKIT